MGWEPQSLAAGALYKVLLLQLKEPKFLPELPQTELELPELAQKRFPASLDACGPRNFYTSYFCFYHLS